MAQHPTQTSGLWNDETDAKAYIEAVKALNRPVGLLVTISILASMNQPKAVTAVIQQALQAEATDPVHLLRLSQDCLIKTAPLCGFPKIINAMGCLMDGVSPDLRRQLEQATPRDSPSIDSTLDVEARGRAFFDRVYGKNADRVRERIGGSSPKLMDIITKDMYGRILSDESLLSGKETELLAIASLSTLNAPIQLRGHLLGARNVGVPQTHIDAVITISRLLLRRR